MRWTWAGARAVGTSHARTGTPCQDAYACSIWTDRTGGEVLIAALADGAGSSHRSEAGARLATRCFIEAVRGSLDDDPADCLDPSGLLVCGVEQARHAVTMLALHEGLALDAFASTLLVAILHSEGGAIGQIGDGATVKSCSKEPRRWAPVHWPDHGEFINTTSFLTEPDGLDKLVIKSFDAPVTDVCLFSDGLERLVLDFRTRAAHAPFFDGIFTKLNRGICPTDTQPFSRQLEELLGSEAVNQRTDDDKSIIVASLRDRS